MIRTMTKWFVVAAMVLVGLLPFLTGSARAIIVPATRLDAPLFLQTAWTMRRGDHARHVPARG